MARPAPQPGSTRRTAPSSHPHAAHGRTHASRGRAQAAQLRRGAGRGGWEGGQAAAVRRVGGTAGTDSRQPAAASPHRGGRRGDGKGARLICGGDTRRETAAPPGSWWRPGPACTSPPPRNPPPGSARPARPHQTSPGKRRRGARTWPNLWQSTWQEYGPICTGVRLVCPSFSSNWPQRKHSVYRAISNSGETPIRNVPAQREQRQMIR